MCVCVCARVHVCAHRVFGSMCEALGLIPSPGVRGSQCNHKGASSVLGSGVSYLRRQYPSERLP
jgi:hypothetical protein